MSSSQGSAQTNQIANPASVPLAPPGQQIQETGTNGPLDMEELNRTARLWMIRNQRRPTNWDDFAAHAGMQIPPPAAGKKYVLSKAMRVTLEDR